MELKEAEIKGYLVTSIEDWTKVLVVDLMMIIILLVLEKDQAPKEEMLKYMEVMGHRETPNQSTQVPLHMAIQIQAIHRILILRMMRSIRESFWSLSKIIPKESKNTANQRSPCSSFRAKFAFNAPSPFLINYLITS